MPVKAQELKTALAPAYGQKLPDLLASYDLSTSSWRTSQLSLEGGLTLFSEIWPRSGTMQNGIAYQLQPLVRLTAGTGGTAWATPRSSSAMAANMSKNLADRCKNYGNLEEQVSATIWPTPKANEDAAGTPNGKMQRMLGNHPGIRGTTPEEWKAGSLNPAWVEWLMGYPSGWTDLED